MTINKQVEEILGKLEKVDVGHILLSQVPFYNKLIELYNNDQINDSLIEKRLEKAIINQARNDFDRTIKHKLKPRNYLELYVNDDCFAYALHKGEFSKRQIKKIPFDHGETLETYVGQHYNSNLPSVLREKLLNPQPTNSKRCGNKKHYSDHFLEDIHPVCGCEYDRPTL